MSNEPSITVVIPVRNRAQLVVRALQSVESQSLRPLRVIVVDNGSTDGTIDAVAAWADAHRADGFIVDIAAESTPGAAAARNRGLELTRSEWILFFDSDDEMLPGHLARVADAIAHNADIDLLGWDVSHITACGKYERRVFTTRYMIYENLFHATLATQRYCARTELFRLAGGWCVDVSIWDDIELGNRLLALAPRVAAVGGAPAVVAHGRGESITGNDFASHLDGYAVALRHIAAQLPEKLRHLTALKMAIVAGRATSEGSPAGRAHFEAAMAGVTGRRRRMLLRLVYAYNCVGGRGAAKILRPFIYKDRYQNG